MAEDSILISIKNLLGLDSEYDVFDDAIVIHINSVFSTLYSLGASPAEPFMIFGSDEKWADFYGNVKQAMMVKSYVYLKVRQIFDPPANSFVMDAMQKQITEFEWRLSIMELVFATDAPGGITEQAQIKALEDQVTHLEEEIDEVDDDVDSVPDLTLLFENKLI